VLEQRRCISRANALRLSSWLASAAAAIGSPNGPRRIPEARPMATRPPTLSSKLSASRRICLQSALLNFGSVTVRVPAYFCGVGVQPARTASPATISAVFSCIPPTILQPLAATSERCHQLFRRITDFYWAIERGTIDRGQSANLGGPRT
jgi:hypothetical protein